MSVAALVPGSGAQPIAVQNWLPPLLAAAGAVLLVPRRWQAVRIGAVAYGLSRWLMPPVPHVADGHIWLQLSPAGC